MDSYEIRTFDPERDRDALFELFGHAGEGAPTGSLWGHRESEAAIYLTPYVELTPDTLYVAASEGRLVGYLTGCLDSSTFPGEDQRLSDAIRRYRLMRRREARTFFARSLLDIVRDRLARRPVPGELDDPRWPSHLHINVAPEARGTGVAAGLMRAWLDTVRASESPGCYLQTLVENDRAVRFFARMGFSAHGPTPPVPGLRFAGGRVHQQTMVIDCREDDTGSR